MSNVIGIKKNHLTLIDGGGGELDESREAPVDQVLRKMQLTGRKLSVRDKAIIREVFLLSVSPILDEVASHLISTASRKSVAQALDDVELSLTEQMSHLVADQV